MPGDFSEEMMVSIRISWVARTFISVFCSFLKCGIGDQCTPQIMQFKASYETGLPVKTVAVLEIFLPEILMPYEHCLTQHVYLKAVILIQGHNHGKTKPSPPDPTWNLAVGIQAPGSLNMQNPLNSLQILPWHMDSDTLSFCESQRAPFPAHNRQRQLYFTTMAG